MKRDFDLIRSILLQIEAAPAGASVSQLSADSTITAPVLIEHIQLLIDVDLVDVEVISAQQCAFGIYRLTWKGHDFLDAARSDAVWTKAKGRLAEVGGGASLEILKALLDQTIKSVLGLPV